LRLWSEATGVQSKYAVVVWLSPLGLEKLEEVRGLGAFLWLFPLPLEILPPLGEVLIAEVAEHTVQMCRASFL